jgi:hypothetical protein
MARHLVGYGIAAVLFVALTLSSGCTQDTKITSGSSGATFEAAMTTPPPDRFETARFELSRALVTALDPDALVNLGATQVDLIPRKQSFDMKSQTAEVFFQTSLPPGEYRLDSLYWVPPTLVDAEASPTAPTCIEKITLFPAPPTTGIQVFPAPVPVSPPIVFTARSGSTVRIRAQIDALALVNDYLTRWTCVDELNGRCLQEPAPCLRAFDAFGFGSAIPQSVTVTVE